MFLETDLKKLPKIPKVLKNVVSGLKSNKNLTSQEEAAIVLVDLVEFLAEKDSLPEAVKALLWHLPRCEYSEDGNWTCSSEALYHDFDNEESTWCEKHKSKNATKLFYADALVKVKNML